MTEPAPALRAPRRLAITCTAGVMLALVGASGCQCDPPATPPQAVLSVSNTGASPAPQRVATAAAPSSPSRARAVARLRASQLFEPLAVAEGALRPAITLKAARTDPQRLAKGAARFGGLPDVPEGFAWPSHVPPRNEAVEQLHAALVDAGVMAERPAAPDGQRRYPLHFLAQLDLAEIARTAAGHEAAGLLPPTGQLYFFYDVEHGGWGFDPKLLEGFRVVYHDVPQGKLVRAEAPAALAASEGVYPWCSLALEAAWSLPSRGDQLYDGLGLDDDDGAVARRYEQLSLELLGHPVAPDAGSAAEPLHHLLGHPQLIQNDMRLEAQLVSHGLFAGDGSGYQDPRAKQLEAGAKDWSLLLQLDTDGECPGWAWGDTGRLYFWIRDQDLQALRFDKAWLALQCY